MSDKENLNTAEQKLAYAQVKSWGRSFNLEQRTKAYYFRMKNKTIARNLTAKDILEDCE